ncbi:MAG: S1C family serine protease [bacterium]
MRRTGLYSSADRSRGIAGKADAQAAGSKQASAGAPAPTPASAPAGRPGGAGGMGGLRGRVARGFARYERTGLVLAGVLIALAVMIARDALQAPARVLTQDDIDRAVLHTLDTKPIPSRAAKAAETVRQSIVRVTGYPDEAAPAASGPSDESKSGAARSERGPGGGAPSSEGRSTGSGVVVVDDGVILTNLHVVAGSKRITVMFHDGSESEAALVRAWPENDLAVLKAKKIPDDLPAATLGSSANLRPGDEVVAVGFPFGIGPSVSAGVVSGLNRQFLSPKGKRVLTRLIQFDAAANPGNSGGPLVTMEGEVVGIVTAILSPNGAGTFIGIGFATTIEAAGGAVGIPPF